MKIYSLRHSAEMNKVHVMNKIQVVIFNTSRCVEKNVIKASDRDLWLERKNKDKTKVRYNM